MQKKLIALVVAGVASGAAFAQSNVTISGQLKGGYQNYKLTGGTAAQNGSANYFSDETSSVVLKGEENLGNGLSAIFQIDSRFTLDQGDSANFGGGNTWVGVKSKAFGEVKLGRQDLHYNEIERIENGAKSLSQQAMAGRGILNKYRDAANVAVGQTRTANVLFWDSPNWSGFTARAAYSTGAYGAEGSTATGAVATSPNPDNGSTWNLVGRYENGPIKTGLSYLKQKAEDGQANSTSGVDSNQDSTRIWGAYNIAGFSLGLAYDQSKAKAINGVFQKRTGWAIPLSYNVGNHGVYLTYAKVGDTTLDTGKVQDSGAKQWSLGYDYSLSKRTSVGINYAKLTNETNAQYNFANTGTGKANVVGANGVDAKQLYIGVRHAY